jgi:hypothetical protein
MTWKELAEKYRKYWEKFFMSDPHMIVIGDGPLYLRFAEEGTVEAKHIDFGKVITCITIATERTPEQMDAIITALTEKK